MMEHEEDYEVLLILIGICDEVNDLLDSTNHDVDDIDYIALITNEDCINDEEIESIGELVVEETGCDVVIRGVFNVDYNEIVVGVKFYDECVIITNLGIVEVD